MQPSIFLVWAGSAGVYWRRLEEVSFEVLYKTKPSAGERESELHYLAKAFVVRHLAERVGLNCVETEKGEGAAVFDVAVTCSGLQGLVVEVETLYGTGTVVHKLVETVERAGKRNVDRGAQPAGGHLLAAVVEDPEGAEERTRRRVIHARRHKPWPRPAPDVASMLVKKWKETTEGAEEAKQHAVPTAEDSATH